MPGIPRGLAEHSLNILKGFKPVKQAFRRFSEPKRQAMGEELAKLLEAEFIREIKHPDWLANLVMVPKKDKSWCLCVDFKDLNKACPKDPFPLPRIEQIIDPTAGHDCCVSSTHTPVTIKSRWPSQTKPQQHPSPHTAHSASTQCLSGSKTLAQHISA